MSDNERKAGTAANAELIRRFGTAVCRMGGARSHLWFEVFNRELDRLNAANTTYVAKSVPQ